MPDKNEYWTTHDWKEIANDTRMCRRCGIVYAGWGGFSDTGTFARRVGTDIHCIISDDDDGEWYAPWECS